jgi:Tfp pilus assembly protein PilF
VVGLNGRRIVAAFLSIATLLVTPGVPMAATSAARAAEADSLHRRAVARLAEGTLDARRFAMAELERASVLDPGSVRIWLDFGRLCMETGRRKRGRSCYEQARRAAPDDAEAHVALGFAWTWEWLSSFEEPPLARAQQSLARATELAPGRAEAWSQLSAVELVSGRVDRATFAARQGHAADSRAWEPLVALACASYRAGELARADSAFRVARVWLPQDLAWRFNDAIWSRDSHDGPPGRYVARAGSAGAGWRGTDPDFTTPENEAQLDYLTRLGLALLLFRDARGVRWDMRTELFVRYGLPASVEVNPLSSPLRYRHNRYLGIPQDFTSYSPDALAYPYNVQAWSYPELGIRVELWDRSLMQSFQLPVSLESDADPRPNPALLASRPDLVSLGGGRGVYRSMPPGSRPIPARAQIARFPSDSGVVLLAHVATAGEPTDTLRGTWAVVASDGRVIARGSGSLSASSCDPTEQRVADFTAAAPPGDYRVHLAVSGAGARRGLVRLRVTVPPAARGLALSDLVILCGLEGASVSPGTVRIEPDMGRRVTGSHPLSVYFEIDQLSRGADGRARFAYTYSVIPVKDDQPRRPTTPAAFEASREESHDGTRRRQFVTIPMRSIRSGTYDLRIEVRDLVAGTAASAETRFVKE